MGVQGRCLYSGSCLFPRPSPEVPREAGTPFLNPSCFSMKASQDQLNLGRGREKDGEEELCSFVFRRRRNESLFWGLLPGRATENKSKDPEREKAFSPPSFPTFPRLPLDRISRTPKIGLKKRKKLGERLRSNNTTAAVFIEFMV